MVIVAGLPLTTHTRAIAELRARFPTWEIRGQPASPRDGGPLYPQDARKIIAELATDFVIRRRARGTQPLAPRSIILLYVPAPDSELLLQTFDFAVMPEPMTALSPWSEAGMQLRHDWQAVEATLHAALAPSGRARTALNLVNERLKRHLSSEGILLPPRTFATAEGRLAEEFRQFRNGARAWSDRLEHLGPSEISHEDVHRIPEGKVVRAFVDDRDIAYLLAHPTAFHAEPRTLEEGEALEARINQLRALYRFGGCVEPGLHHGAVFADGTAFLRTPFTCSREGDIEVTASYLNIYPDDYLRPPKAKKR